MKLKAFCHSYSIYDPKKLIKKLNIRRACGQKAALFPGPKNRVFRPVFSAPKNGLFLVVLKFGPYFRGPEIWPLFLVVLKNDHPAVSDRHIPRNGILPVFRIPLKFPFLYLPLKNRYIKNNYYLQKSVFFAIG